MVRQQRYPEVPFPRLLTRLECDRECDWDGEGGRTQAMGDLMIEKARLFPQDHVLARFDFKNQL